MSVKLDAADPFPVEPPTWAIVALTRDLQSVSKTAPGALPKRKDG